MKPFNARLIALGAAAVLGAGSTAAAQDTAATRTRVAPPAPLPARPIVFPAYTESTLPNGLRVMVVENHTLPVANLNLYVRTGSAADPRGKQGLASMTADLLDNGTQKRTARQIAESIEGVGGSLSTSADRDVVSVGAGVLADQLPLAFDLVSDVVLHPAFPADEVETVRRQRLSALQSALGDAGQIAQRRFDREVYGADHPYGSAATPETVRGITREEMAQFHRAHFTPGNALLVVSGDVTPARARELARQYFGSWTGARGAAPALAAPAARERTGIVLVHRPGAVQSSIRVGHPGIRPDNPDYYALQVMNTVLGGLPTSRLETVIRGQRGWTYAARSAFTRPVGTGVFAGEMEVRTPVTDSALAEMLVQLRRIRDQPVPQAELESARNFLVGSFPLRFETPAATAAQLANLRLLGLPVESLKEFTQRVSAVTAADVQRVARQYVHPDRATIVVVGDATRVLRGLEAIAPVTLFDVEGKPLDRSALEVRASVERFDGARLQPATLTYSVLVQGNPFGTATTVLARDGSGWVSTQTVQAGPSNQQGEVRFTSDLTPVSLKQTITAGPARLESELRYAAGRVTGSAKLPPQMGGDKTVDAQVVAGTRFQGMDSWILAASDLAAGKTMVVPVFSVQSGSAVPVTFRVTGEEKVTVPAGTFDAFRVETSGGEQTAVLWVRKSAPHVVLKQAPAGQPVTIELQSMR